jgi:nickel/cobalt exporter
MIRPIIRFVGLVCALVFLPAGASAHPVPKNNHDRTIDITLTPDAVVIDYQLEVDETRAALDMTQEAIAGITNRRDFYAAYLRFLAPVLATNLDARLDNKELKFTCVRQHFVVTDHIQANFRFRAEWSLVPQRQHAFTFRESNFDEDDFSALRLHLTIGPGVALLSHTAPDEALMNRPGIERRPGEDERLRKASATFVLEPGAVRGVVKDDVPPTLAPRRPPRKGQRVAVGRPGVADSGAKGRSQGPTATSAEEAGVEGEVHSRDSKLLHLLYNTQSGLVVLLALAAVFGAAHALTPGHGKAMVAAYLVGERGTIWHALVLGIVVTLTHTAAVLVLAGLLPVLYPDTARAGLTGAERTEVARVMGLVCGLLMAGLGFWLLLQRLAGRADHVHIGGGHSHGQDQTEEPTKPGWWSLITLGVTGGIVPCWDALLMLLSPVGLARPTLALPLVLAFSAGLALTLVSIGIAVVYAHRHASSRWGESERFQRVVRVLPIFTAALITALGLWLCFDSVRPDGPVH